MVSLSTLRKICQPNLNEETLRFRMYRRVSLYLTYVIVRNTNWSANFITLLSFVAGILSAMVIGYGHLIIGVALYHVHSLLDYVDGEVARFRRTASVRGVLLDGLMHSMVTPLILGALYWATFVRTGDLILLVMCLFAVAGRLYLNFLEAFQWQVAVQSLLLADGEKVFVSRARLMPLKIIEKGLFIVIGLIGLTTMVLVFATIGDLGYVEVWASLRVFLIIHGIAYLVVVVFATLNVFHAEFSPKMSRILDLVVNHIQEDSRI